MPGCCLGPPRRADSGTPSPTGVRGTFPCRGTFPGAPHPAPAGGDLPVRRTPRPTGRRLRPRRRAAPDVPHGPATRAHALLDVAAELLWPVLRDAALLRDVAQAASATPGLRRAAMVPLALLGGRPTAADFGRCQGGDPLDGRAALLAQTLGGAPVSDLLIEDAALALAARRMGAGRLLTALG